MVQRTQSLPFRAVLAGCDGSPEASDAVALAVSLAGICDAGLTLAGIYSHPLIPFPESYGDTARKHATEAVLRHERDAQLSQFDQRAPRAHIVAEPDTSVSRALRRVARREGIDLVVLGSASSAQAGRTQPGPHARQLLHNAPCAAALAPRGYRERPSSLRRIAVAYDGGDEARAALRVAAELARQTGGQLRIHEVVDERMPLGLKVAMDVINGRAIDWGSLLSAEHDEARRRVREAASALSVDTDATVSLGEPGFELRKLSEMVDLIVLGSMHLARRERLGIGDTAEKVLDGAACPVLVVARPQTAAAARPSRRWRICRFGARCLRGWSWPR